MSLTGIKGIGEKRKKILEEHGIFDLEDLMSFFPCKYIDLTKAQSLNECIDGDYAALRGVLSTELTIRFVRKGLNYAKATVIDKDGGSFSILYYNRPYIKNQLLKGKEYIFFGKVSQSKTITLLNPIIEKIENNASNESEGRILTIYPAIKGIPKNVIKETIQKNICYYNPSSIIPLALRDAYELMPLRVAYETLHKPTANIENATRAVAIEELVQLILAFKLTKQKRPKREISYIDCSNEIQREIKNLPYTLTSEQEIALKEILNDLNSEKYMNRLLQGDVGSGKSIIAFLAMYFVAKSSFQAVLMAPTEVLACQHFEKFTKLFPSIPAVLLTGGMPKREQENSRLNILSGAASVIFGTHSLFSQSVKYKALRLVITDEQHRFGVSERSSLEEKSRNVDSLLLSATPIPRTLALIMYGDLSISFLKDTLPNRKPIQTRIVPLSRQEDMLRYILEESKKNNLSYIVMPRVEGEEDDAESVKAMYNNLKKGIFKNAEIGLLYGSMKSSEKQRVFEEFRQGKIKILIATTVIEVGVDASDAKIIAIYGADRFGLSQLHQLRGRVGRGDKESYCFLLAKDESNERLKLICKTQSGFELSEYDLKTRGAGDFIGLRQHGISSLSNLKITNEILMTAREIAAKIWDDESSDFTLRLKKSFRSLIDSVVMN